MALATKVNAYNVYQDGVKLVGIADEVSLPDFDALTETLSGAGILGEIDEPLLGHFGASEIEIPFRTLDEEMFKLLSAGSSVNLTLRLSTQAIEESTLANDFMPSRIVIRGKSKGFSGGSIKQGSGTGSSVKVEILYFLVEVNEKKKFELDKINFVYKVDGNDLLAKVRKQV
ncbi:MAG: phage major tail tube protein [Coprobacillus sp.]|nr:phage major tail tube protein [Coprobacillus sp.]